MGISGLLPLLKEIQVSGNIADFKGKRLAVDAYVWLHRGAFGCAEDLVKGKRTTKFVDYAMYRVRMLRYHGITPFVVFDGGPLPAKRGTEESREKSRADSLVRAQAFEAQGRRKEARDCYTKCVDITPEMAYQLIKALRAEGVTYVVAPYEADAQLCFLEREGFVDGIITEDSDLLVFGCKTVIFKLEKDGSCVSIDRSRLTSIRDLPMHQWTDTQFRRMAMLSGCDYLPSIPGIGLKKAHGMLRRYKSVEKSLQAIRLEGSHTIPPNYLEAFKQAELAFLYQRVFCPHRRCLVPLNPFPDEGLKEEDEKWIGSDVSNEVARGMAQGDLHPETRKPINDLWPDFQPCPKAGATASKTPAGKGPLDNWLTIRKRTTSAPTVRPVGGHTSGVTTLSNLNAATGVGRHRSEPTPPPSTVKVSKHFKSKAKEPTVPDTPKTQFSLHWEESDVVPTQVDRDQSRSPSPENIPSSPPVLVPSSPACDRIRSLSPEVSTARPSPSPAQTPLRVRSHFVKDEPFTSPFSHVSSPPAGTPPDSLDRALDAEYPDIDAVMSRTAPSSPTPSSSRVLIAASSQVASFGSTPCGNIFIHGSSQMATVASSPSATPLARTKMRSITSILVPASSPSLQAAPTVATKGSSSRGVSSDSIADDDIVTPAADSVPRRSLPGKRAREREVENSDPEAEARARVISQGWATRWSFDGQTSSSPAPAHGKRQAVATPLNSNGPLSTKKTVNASTAPTTSKPYTAGVDTPLGSSSRQQSKQPKHQPQPKSSLFSRPACKSAARPAAHAPAPQPHGMTVNALERFRYSRK